VARIQLGWLNALRWQRLSEMEEMETLGHTLANHLEGIAAYCDLPVRLGVVESFEHNDQSRPAPRPRHARRRDAAAQAEMGDRSPIRSAPNMARFLSPKGLYSNR
jgi:hypothetical protein